MDQGSKKEKYLTYSTAYILHSSLRGLGHPGGIVAHPLIVIKTVSGGAKMYQIWRFENASQKRE